MANSALTLSQLSMVALAAGIDMGFNAVGVESLVDSETFEIRLAFTFCERGHMRKPRLRTPCEWALSYDENAECIRDSRTIEMPHSVVYDASYDIQQRI